MIQRLKLAPVAYTKIFVTKIWYNVSRMPWLYCATCERETSHKKRSGQCANCDLRERNASSPARLARLEARKEKAIARRKAKEAQREASALKRQQAEDEQRSRLSRATELVNEIKIQTSKFRKRLISQKCTECQEERDLSHFYVCQGERFPICHRCLFVGVPEGLVPYLRRTWYNLKKRAKDKGWPFTLLPRDISVPQTCPVLGIPIDFVIGDRRDSPSIDRIDGKKGYVPENIKVISNRANALKSDASVEELEAVLHYVRTGRGLFEEKHRLQ